jgi:hypothetical protein
MPESTLVLKSLAGIKRDGTKYDGDFYIDGQWVRFQRGLPRKIGGYRSINKYLTEISRGFNSFTQQSLQYCHSAGSSAVERFTIDETKNSSVISSRTPVAVAAKGTTTLTGTPISATGTITLATGAAGSIDTLTVNGVSIISAAVNYVTSLDATATALAANINAHTSVPNYTAVAVGTTVTITAVTSGPGPNGFVVAATYTTLTGSTTNMAGGSGSVDSITVNGVTITSGSVAFTTDLSTTATAVAANITAFTSTPNYTAAAVGAVITITASTAGQGTNGFVVVTNVTTLTATSTNMAGGLNALAVNAYNQWMFQTAYDASTTANSIIAHVAPNLQCVCNDVGGQIFYGDVLGTAALKEIPLPAGANATGGIVMLFPYLFYYGTAGIIGWSVPGTFTNLSGSGSGIARVWGQKIVKGMPLRAGSGSAPAGIFWAYDAVIRATFTGSATVFQFDTIATDTSIMSPDCVVDYDGVFFWCGVDRFLMFNGVVREVPNQLNLNYFFDNINESQRAKVFAFKVPHFGEIWWCYPRDDATECTHAIVYNVRENTWYDTALPASGRASGGYNNGFAAPLLTDCITTPSGYRVWIHEQGVDEIDGQFASPIESYFETADLSTLPQGKNEYLRITGIEPDFVQNGPMTVQVTGRANARAPEVYSSVFSFPETATEPYQQIVMLKEQRRELRVRFESNAVGGDYQMGQIIGHIDSGDKTVLG